MPVRHDWYQTDSKVVITVLLKNPAEKKYAVQIGRENVQMTAENYKMDLVLQQPIVVERSSHKAFPSKVEIILVKEKSERWLTLEKKDYLSALAAAAVSPPPMHKKNWDGLVKAAEEAEEEEVKGVEALNRLYKNIYSTASSEVQKAMSKSFTESGGTVPSTNWSKISNEKVEVKPPKDAEFHK